MQGGGGVFDSNKASSTNSPTFCRHPSGSCSGIVASSKSANGREVDAKADVYRISCVGDSEN